VESTSGVIRETVDLLLGADVERVSAGGLQPEAEYHRSAEPVRACPGQTGHVLNPAAFSRPNAYKFGTAAPTLPWAYYDVLSPHACRIDLWITEYVHLLPGVVAIVDWYRSTGLRPFLQALVDDVQGEQFLLE
jgi:hypothetical protein